MLEISKNKTIHFIGIGGCGMSAIAKILLEQGYKVSGSDLKETITTIRLRDYGATIYIGHQAAHLRHAHIIVYSSAIPKDNPELATARHEKMVIYHRSDMLNFLMQSHTKRIAVTGTHGKTTTTSLINRILQYAQKKPTYVIGGEMQDYGDNAALGDQEYFVCEADESDGSFLQLCPNIAVINNIEAEHMDYFKRFDNVIRHFKQLTDNVFQNNGYIIANADDPHIAKLMQTYQKERVFYYSIQAESDLMAKEIKYNDQGVKFNVFYHGKDHGEVYLQIFGIHNVYNALAAIRLGLEEGLTLDNIKQGLYHFHGAKRRFHLIGEQNQIKIYDDYGHHPTEIKVTLEAIKQSFPNRLICIFQPHRYTRTRDLLEQFPDAFMHADRTIITEVYSANEKAIKGISGELIVEKMKARDYKQVAFIPNKSEIAHVLIPELKPGDLVITMGAGDIHTVAKEILSRLKAESGSSN